MQAMDSASFKRSHVLHANISAAFACSKGAMDAPCVRRGLSSEPVSAVDAGVHGATGNGRI